MKRNYLFVSVLPLVLYLIVSPSVAFGRQATTDASQSLAYVVGRQHGQQDGADDAKNHRYPSFKTKHRYTAPPWNSAMGDESLYLKEYKDGFKKGYREGYVSPATYSTASLRDGKAAQ